MRTGIPTHAPSPGHWPGQALCLHLCAILTIPFRRVIHVKKEVPVPMLVVAAEGQNYIPARDFPDQSMSGAPTQRSPVIAFCLAIRERRPVCRYPDLAGSSRSAPAVPDVLSHLFSLSSRSCCFCTWFCQRQQPVPAPHSDLSPWLLDAVRPGTVSRR